MKVAIPLAKDILVPLGGMAAASAIDVGIQKKERKKEHKSELTMLIISKKEINHAMKIIKVREDSGILLKGVTKIIKNEPKERDFKACY